MIHDLELEFWGAIKLDPTPEEASGRDKSVLTYSILSRLNN